MTILSAISNVTATLAPAPAKAAGKDLGGADLDFAATLARVGGAPLTAPVELPETAIPVGKGSQSGKPDDLQQFEGFVLRTFVEAMMPKENSSFFGTGSAGEIWRSMLAERLGDEIAASGGIGLADLLADQNQPAGSVNKAADRMAAAGDEQLSTAGALTRAP